MPDERTAALEAKMTALHAEHETTRTILMKHVEGCEKVRIDNATSITKLRTYVALLVFGAHLVFGTAAVVVITNMVKGQLRSAVNEVVTDASDREQRE